MYFKKLKNKDGKKPMNKLKYFTPIIFFLLQVSCAQNLNNKKFLPLVATSYSLHKVQCDCDTIGYKINIKVGHPSDDEQNCHYANPAIIRAADTLKMDVLMALLTMAEKDSSLCCTRVKRYGFEKSSKPQSITYNLQIDALYSFNFIAFGVEARKFSPYPVLYNTETNKEINSSTDEINEVVRIYKEWFLSVVKTGFKDYKFPLAGTKYKWLSGTDKVILFHELPSHPQVDNLGYPL
jgi:hypothetical protein